MTKGVDNGNEKELRLKENWEIEVPWKLKFGKGIIRSTKCSRESQKRERERETFTEVMAEVRISAVPTVVESFWLLIAA